MDKSNIRSDLILKINDCRINDKDCQCDSFSDCFKDINGFRPKYEWSCEEIKQWFKDNYKTVIL